MANVLIDENILIGWADQIREKTGSSEKMRPSVLLEKTESLGSGGGSSDLVKYVTFMSEDGTEKLYKMPVLSGDDCKDPVTHGDIDAPTKESTTTETFTHSGWSLEIGGEADSTALSDVTANRVVYAAFASSVRYYTVSYYDEDGTTLLKTVKVTYGADASNYKPEKSGYEFTGWNPNVSNVTSDINTVAMWEESKKLNDYSWADIAAFSADGTASTRFAIGDTKEINYYNASNKLVIGNAMIIGFNHDDLADGSGKAGITFWCDFMITTDGDRVFTAAWNSTFTSSLGYYVKNVLPNDISDVSLKSVIKEVTKSSLVADTTNSKPYANTTDKFFCLSAAEIGCKDYTDGKKYAYFGDLSFGRLESLAGTVLDNKFTMLRSTIPSSGTLAIAYANAAQYTYTDFTKTDYYDPIRVAFCV